MDWSMLIGWAAGFLMGMAATLMLGAAAAAGQADEADSRREERRKAGIRREGEGKKEEGES